LATITHWTRGLRLHRQTWHIYVLHDIHNKWRSCCFTGTRRMLLMELCTLPGYVFSFLWCPIMCLYVLNSVLWCPLRVQHKKRRSIPSLPPADVGGIMSYLHYLCLLPHSGIGHILCCVFALFFFVLCTLCCQFLWIVHFGLPLQYSITFICPVSCVPYVASFSGLSIVDCPFSIL
jgi:hypothetical protein